MIAIGSDHVGYEYKEKLIQFLLKNGKPAVDFGCFSNERTDYPIYGLKVADAVASKTISRGILICGTGVGMSLAANQIRGIRAVVCSDPYTAKLSREHNDTNILALGSRVIGLELAEMIILNWLDVPFQSMRHQERIQIFEAARN
ncbi:MAG: ribose 5-phosphate isomerase B [Parachlamydiales bacterium]|nr:ribose 5-phosphate isomerase B [Parachlamydiales bacterium]